MIVPMPILSMFWYDPFALLSPVFAHFQWVGFKRRDLT